MENHGVAHTHLVRYLAVQVGIGVEDVGVIVLYFFMGAEPRQYLIRVGIKCSRIRVGGGKRNSIVVVPAINLLLNQLLG